MNQIDRVILKAKRLAGGAGRLCAAVVCPIGEKWEVVTHFWDKVKPAVLDRTIHDTMEDSCAYLEGKTATGDSPPIIIIDV